MANDEKKRELLKDLVYCNENSVRYNSISQDAEKSGRHDVSEKYASTSKEYHTHCQDCVVKLGSDSGIIGSHFGCLNRVGEGKIGDDTCNLTLEYAKALLDEETGDMDALRKAEELERVIRHRAEEKGVE